MTEAEPNLRSRYELEVDRNRLADTLDEIEPFAAAENRRPRQRPGTSESLEVLQVSGHHGHAVHERGRADQSVTERCRIWHVKRRRAACNPFVDDEESARERRRARAASTARGSADLQVE